MAIPGNVALAQTQAGNGYLEFSPSDVATGTTMTVTAPNVARAQTQAGAGYLEFLPGEGAVQSLLLHGDGLAHLANTYYAVVHFPATAAFLVWLYLRRPAHYVWARRVLAAVTAAALVLHLVFPLAPPRMLAATGLVDTARVYGPSVYGPPEADGLSNQFAAMPSLHFGWALMVAVGLVVATRAWWRWLWLLHPLVTLLVIVGTANHFWLDALVAAALLGLALVVLRLPRHTGAGRARAPHVPDAPARDRALAGAGR